MIKYFALMLLGVNCYGAAPSGLGGAPLSPVSSGISSSGNTVFTGSNLISGPIITVYPDGTVMGPSGKINTAGTTTSGIQEALNAAPFVSFQTNYASGCAINLIAGVYNCSGSIVISNQLSPINYVIRGAGKANTVLRYIGSGIAFWNVGTDVYSGPAGGSSLNITFEHIGFVDVNTNTPCSLLRLFALNEADFDDCLFTKDYMMTNNGSALNYIPVTRPNMTVGIECRGDNMLRVRNSAFWNLAWGIKGNQDHSRVIDTIFDGIRDLNSYLTCSTDGQYTYPKSCAFMATGDAVLTGCHWNGNTIDVLSDGFIQNCFPVFENETYHSVVDPGNNGQILVLYPNPFMDSGYTATDKQIDASCNITTAPLGYVVNITSDTDLSGTTPFQITSSGNTLLSLSSAGLTTVGGGMASSKTPATAPTAITFPNTTILWTNTQAFNIVLYINNSGITGTAIAKNGQQIFSSLISDVTLALKPGDYFSETYTVGTPSARWEPQ